MECDLELLKNEPTAANLAKVVSYLLDNENEKDAYLAFDIIFSSQGRTDEEISEIYDLMANLCRNDAYRGQMSNQKFFKEGYSLLENSDTIALNKHKVLRAVANVVADNDKARSLFLEMGLFKLLVDLCFADSELLCRTSMVAISNLVRDNSDVMVGVWTGKLKEEFFNIILHKYAYKMLDDIVDAMVSNDSVAVNLLLELKLADFVFEVITGEVDGEDNVPIAPEKRDYLVNFIKTVASWTEYGEAIESEVSAEKVYEKFKKYEEVDDLAEAFLEILSAVLTEPTRADKFFLERKMFDHVLEILNNNSTKVRTAASHVVASLANSREVSLYYFSSDVIDVLRDLVVSEDMELNVSGLAAISNIVEDSQCAVLIEKDFVAPIIGKAGNTGDAVCQGLAAGIIRNLILYGPSRTEMLKNDDFLRSLELLLNNENPVLQLIPIVCFRHILKDESIDSDGFFRILSAERLLALLNSSEWHIQGETIRLMLSMVDSNNEIKDEWKEAAELKERILELNKSQNKFIRQFTDSLMKFL